MEQLSRTIFDPGPNDGQPPRTILMRTLVQGVGPGAADGIL